MLRPRRPQRLSLTGDSCATATDPEGCTGDDAAASPAESVRRKRYAEHYPEFSPKRKATSAQQQQHKHKLQQQQEKEHAPVSLPPPPSGILRAPQEDGVVVPMACKVELHAAKVAAAALPQRRQRKVGFASVEVREMLIDVGDSTVALDGGPPLGISPRMKRAVTHDFELFELERETGQRAANAAGSSPLKRRIRKDLYLFHGRLSADVRRAMLLAAGAHGDDASDSECGGAAADGKDVAAARSRWRAREHAVAHAEAESRMIQRLRDESNRDLFFEQQQQQQQQQYVACRDEREERMDLDAVAADDVFGFECSRVSASAPPRVMGVADIFSST